MTVPDTCVKFSYDTAVQAYKDLLYLSNHGGWPGDSLPDWYIDMGRGLGVTEDEVARLGVLFAGFAWVSVAHAFADQLGLLPLE